MSVTATYVNDLGRILVQFSGAPIDADYALVERSTDGINWRTVRGGDRTAIFLQAGQIYDYAFTPGVVNTYRVRYARLSISFIAAGTAVYGNNASVVPSNPAGIADGDLKLIWASIRNSGVGAVGPAPAGWTKLISFGNTALLGKKHVTGDPLPTITFTGGAAGDDTIAQMAAFRNVDLTPSNWATSLNASAQDIFVPSATVPGAGLILFLGWKQDDLTSVATPAFAGKVGDLSTTTGNDAGGTWFWFGTVGPPTTPAWGGQNLAVTGGASAISRGITATFPISAYMAEDITTVTPTFGNRVWLKNVMYPSQNVMVDVVAIGDTSRPSRGGVFEVVGRTMPVPVTDLQGSRRLTIRITVPTIAEANEMDERLATGQPLFLQAPSADHQVPTMYAVLDGINMSRGAAHNSTRRFFDLQLIECAEPGASVNGDTITWSDVVAQYATWADVIAANINWTHLLNSVATGNVIVP
jgi:hypothetical protein